MAREWIGTLMNWAIAVCQWQYVTTWIDVDCTSHCMPRIQNVLWPFLWASERAELRTCCRKFQHASPKGFHSTTELLEMLQHGGKENALRVCRCLSTCNKHLGKAHANFKALLREFRRQTEEGLISLQSEECALLRKAYRAIRRSGEHPIYRALADLAWIEKCVQQPIENDASRHIMAVIFLHGSSFRSCGSNMHHFRYFRWPEHLRPSVFLKGKTRIPKPTSSTCDRKYIAIATHDLWNCSYICFNCTLLQNLLGLLLFMTFYVELRPFANHAAIGHVPKPRWLFATKLHALACKHRANTPGKVTLPFLYMKPTLFYGLKARVANLQRLEAKSSSLLNEDPPRVLEPQFNNCVPNEYVFFFAVFVFCFFG